MIHDIITYENVGLTEKMEEVRSAHELPGLAWAVAPLRGPLVAGAVGVRRLHAPDPLTLHDRLHLGSCTKPMTATLIASLVPDVLRWDHRVVDVFGDRDVHAGYREATLSHLLAHTAGVPTFGESSDFEGAPDDRQAFARYVLQRPPQKPIGEYGYSNAGFGIAAVMAELATNRTWEALLLQRVAVPLGLKSTGFGWPANLGDDQPWGHTWNGQHLAPHDPSDGYVLSTGIAPAGDVHMSICDFASFARDHLLGLHGRGALLDAESYLRLHTPWRSDLRSGLGWGVSTYADKRSSSHSGSADTFHALLLVLPDDEHAFTVIANAAGRPAEDGTRHALRELAAYFTDARVAES